MNRRRTAFWLIGLVFLFGCSNKKAIEQATEREKEVCACNTAQCAKQKLDWFSDWFLNTSPRGSREDVETITEAYRRAEECVAAQVKKEREATGPNAPTSAEAANQPSEQP